MAQDVRIENESGTPSLPALTSEQVAEFAARVGLDRKAEDVVVLDVRELSTYADFLVLMTAESDRQVAAVADAVDTQLRKAGHRPIGVEGMSSGNWVLIDLGDVVVHVFLNEARSFYDLDGLWADARRRPMDAATTAPVGSGPTAAQG